MSGYARKLSDGRYRYGAGKTIFTEKLVDGILSFRDFRTDGIPSQVLQEESRYPSFDLTVEGQSLYFGWSEESFTVRALPKEYVGAKLLLKNSELPLTLQVETVCGHRGFFSRTLKLTNIGGSALAVTSVVPLRGRIFKNRFDVPTQLTGGKSIYSVGHFASDCWGSEANFVWTPVERDAGVHYGSQHGRSGHNHPFGMVRNDLRGDYFMAQLAWSSNWSFSAGMHFNGNVGGNESVAEFSIAPASPAPMRVLEPGETWEAPMVLFGGTHEDMDELINGLHQFQMENVMKRVVEQPAIINNWGYMLDQVSDKALQDNIDCGAAIGGEMYILDAGWYGAKGCTWYESTGDWIAGERMPNDLYQVIQYARNKGMKFGLWIEPEAAGDKSSLALQHPDWFVQHYGMTEKRVLDLAKPEVEKFVGDSIMELVERYGLDLIRLDYNSDMFEGGFNTRCGKTENSLCRHVEAIWRIFDRIREKYPEIQLENCSSGGGRTDIGIVSRFTTTWTSDWMRQPRAAQILNGMTMVLPPSFVGRQTGVSMEGTWAGSLDAEMQTVIMGHPSVSGYAENMEDICPESLSDIKHYYDIFKNFIRPMHRHMNTYHHTPEAEKVGWVVLEYADYDKKTAVAMLERMEDWADKTYRIYFKGLCKGKTYEVTTVPGDCKCVLSGHELMEIGLEVSIENACNSKMFLVKEV